MKILVGFDGSILAGNRRPFNQRQQISLHPFARNIRTAPPAVRA